MRAMCGSTSNHYRQGREKPDLQMEVHQDNQLSFAWLENCVFNVRVSDINNIHLAASVHSEPASNAKNSHSEHHTIFQS